MGKFIKFPSFAEALGILVVVAVGAIAWKKLVPTKFQAMI